MSAQEYMILLLTTAGVALMIALTIAVVQIVMMLISVRRTGNEVKKKAASILSAVDIASVVLGGITGAKKRIGKAIPYKSTVAALAGGVKKSMNVFLNKKKKIKGDK